MQKGIRKGKEYELRKSWKEVDEGRKRKKLFKLYLYDDEYIALKEFSENISMSMSNYIRAAIFFNNIKVISKEWEGDIKKVIYELNKIGNNVNQIAFNCNSKGTANIDDVKRLSDQVDKMSIFIENTVLDIHKDN